MVKDEENTIEITDQSIDEIDMDEGSPLKKRKGPNLKDIARERRERMAAKEEAK